MGRKKKNTKTIKNDILGGILIVLSLIFIVFLTFENIGVASEFVANILKGFLGVTAYVFPFIFMFVGIYCIMSDEKISIPLELFKGIFACVTVASIVHVFTETNFIVFNNIFMFVIETFSNSMLGSNLSGVLGAIISVTLVNLIGIIASRILIIFLAIISVLYFLKLSFRQVIQTISNIIKFIVAVCNNIISVLFKNEVKIKQVEEKMKEKGTEDVLQNLDIDKSEQVEFDFNKLSIKPCDEKTIAAKNQRDDFFKKQIEKKEDKSIKEVLTLDHVKLIEEDNYVFPPVSLLGMKSGSNKNLDKKSIHSTAVKLQKTLSSFGVDAKVTNITKGPTVTRYELTPSTGVKVSKIVNLADDIALNLAAKTIRIEAPIPGKSAVGIEVPNTKPDSVFLREVIESKEFKDNESAISYSLGRNASGDIIIGDIAKMPHMLIAGATGAGKSVCINSLIISLLYKSKPSDVKLILIDPKMVELSCYNGIPHLLIPVVTDPKKAAGALNWAVQEMVNRYSLFASKGVKDIKGYNTIIEQDTVKLPQIVIIIDELSDLMMVAPNDVEDAICRLAQMARAAGMHLVIATQRPSVDVITGIIKANIPSRIAFTVSSQVDSRTILDMAGAEKLLGKGDMLYFPVGSSKPQRIQGTWISEKEIESIVKNIKNNYEAVYSDDIIETIEKSGIKGKKQNENEDDADPILNDAIDLVMDMGQASASMLQRKFKIGYSRAGRLVDQMEARGLISGYDGSKPRQVLISKEEWQELKFSMEESTS